MMNRILFAVAILGLFAIPATFAEDEKKGPKITNKVFFDITIDGKEIGTSITLVLSPRSEKTISTSF